VIDDEDALRELLDRAVAPPQVRKEIPKAARPGRHARQLGAAPDAPSLAPADLHLARGSGQGDRNSEVPMPIAQAGASRTLPVSPMNRNASTSTMIPAALTTKNTPTAMAAAPSAGR
jgi:hypothetical protein